jgi:hypothetical protein
MTKRENARPAQPLPLVKTDLATLPLGQDVMVWLGHSSWYLQLAGKRILIDPVFSDMRRRSPLLIKLSRRLSVAGGRDAGDRSADHLPRSLRPSGLRHHRADAEN